MEQCRSEMTNQAKTNNLNYLIDPPLDKVNWLALSFKNEYEDINERLSFSKYFILTVEIKDFNVLIDDKSCLNLPIKNTEETYKRFIEMSKNYHWNDYLTGNLLNFVTLQIIAN